MRQKSEDPDCGTFGSVPERTDKNKIQDGGKSVIEKTMCPQFYDFIIC
jgi:hypothetical protein